MSSHSSGVNSERTLSAFARAMRTLETIELVFSRSNAQYSKHSDAIVFGGPSSGSSTNAEQRMTERQSHSKRPLSCE